MYNNLLGVICAYVPRYFPIFYKNDVICNVASYYMTIGYKKIFELACKKNNRKTVEYLLNRKKVGGMYKYELNLACRGGHIQIVQLMIEKGATDWGWGLAGACEGGHMQLVQMMIDKGATWWNEGLLCACYGGHIEIVKLMIEKGATCWDRGLKCACIGGHMEIVKLMIEKGANNWNWGLQSACEGGHMELVQ